MPRPSGSHNSPRCVARRKAPTARDPTHASLMLKRDRRASLPQVRAPTAAEARRAAEAEAAAVAAAQAAEADAAAKQAKAAEKKRQKENKGALRSHAVPHSGA